MTPWDRQLVALLIVCASTFSFARLEFDSKANNVQIYGPYIKYNVLKPPYSFGRYQFSLDDIALEIERSDESDGNINLYTKWPRFLLSFGRIRIINVKGRVLLNENFTEEQIGVDEKFARLYLDGEGQELLDALDEKFQICVDQRFEVSYVKACSNFLIYKEGQIKNFVTGPNPAAAKINKKRAPKNSQISLDEGMKNVSVEIKFKTGFVLYVKDKVRIIDIENVAIDPQEKRLGIISGDGSIRPTRLTLKDKFFSFIKEKNYFKNQYGASSDWPQNLEDAEMEFAPYQTGASSQLYGIILPHVPPPFKFKLNDDIPIATYSNRVELRGTKEESEVLAAKVKNELFIHENNREFLWNFPADQSGEVNQNYLSLQHKGNNYYFSKRIFRAHQTNISGSLALSTSPTLDIVPGYNFNADHWFEQIWNKSKYSYQRWGLQANIYETLGSFRPKDGFPEKISVLPMNFDIMFRLTPGVRPVQSSFGLGIRYLDFTLFRSISTNIQTRLLGIGGFWHTAPQKIIDDIFNIIPFFRYPKWMELSFYYYPLLLGPEKAGFSFSWQARGKMFFSKRWFMDASFNVNVIQFESPVIRGVTPGFENFSIGTAHGTIGLGAIF